MPAAFGEYRHEHTRRWAAAVESYDGFVFVTPEYNHAMPAALKNAIDFLFVEWQDKAAGFVSHGVHGGVRAVEQLRLTMGELRVADVRAQVALSAFTDFEISDPTQPGRLTAAAHQEQTLAEMLDEVVAWPRALRPLRALPAWSARRRYRAASATRTSRVRGTGEDRLARWFPSRRREVTEQMEPRARAGGPAAADGSGAPTPTGGLHGVGEATGRRTRRRTVTLHGERVGFWESIPAHEVPAGHDEPWRHATGEVVVLVHGIAGSAQTWQPVLAELARRRDPRHVIVPDLVGHGSSSAPWADYSLGGYATGIRDLLAALGYDHAAIVGHSLGGGVVQQFALQFPQHCDRLVLVATGGLGREVSPVLRAATLPGAEWVLPALTHRHVVSTAGWLAHTATRALPGLAQWWNGSVGESARSLTSLTDPVHRRAFLHTVRSVIDPGGQRVRASDRLYLTVGLPTLIVWGTADTMIPVAHGHRAHHLIPGSRLELFDGAGHFPHADRPERFTDLLVEFLDHNEPAPRSPREQAARIAAHSEFDPPDQAPDHPVARADGRPEHPDGQARGRTDGH